MYKYKRVSQNILIYQMHKSWRFIQYIDQLNKGVLLKILIILVLLGIWKVSLLLNLFKFLYIQRSPLIIANIYIKLQNLGVPLNWGSLLMFSLLLSLFLVLFATTYCYWGYLLLMPPLRSSMNSFFELPFCSFLMIYWVYNDE